MTDIHKGAERRGGFIFSLILALLAVGIVAGGSYYYRNFKQNTRADVESRLSAIADLKVDELGHYRQGRLGDGAIFHKNAAFSALVRRYFENPKDLQARDQLRTWLGHIQAASHYDRVMLLDPQYSKKMVVPEGPERSTSLVSPVSWFPSSMKGMTIASLESWLCASIRNPFSIPSLCAGPRPAGPRKRCSSAVTAATCCF